MATKEVKKDKLNNWNTNLEGRKEKERGKKVAGKEVKRGLDKRKVGIKGDNEGRGILMEMVQS